MGPGKKLAVARAYATPALTQAELAAQLEIDTSSVGRWEATDQIPKARIETVCRILKIHRNWLLDPNDTRTPTELRADMVSEVTSESATPADRRYLKSGYVALPTWRGVAAGAEDEDYFMDPDYPEFREVSSFLVSDPDSHVLCIPEGDSMSPRINERERAIVRLDPDVPAGYLVAARSPEGRTYIKRLVRVDGKRELRSINPNFEPITNLRGWDLRGGVIAILKDVEPGQPNMEYDDGRYLRA